jgi:hypothetical protein
LVVVVNLDGVPEGAVKAVTVAGIDVAKRTVYIAHDDTITRAWGKPANERNRASIVDGRIGSNVP